MINDIEPCYGLLYHAMVSSSHWRFIKLINLQCTMPYLLALAYNTASKALEATACSLTLAEVHFLYWKLGGKQIN